MYSKKYLRDQVLAAFESDEVEGNLAELVADVLSEYAYLHQLIDINILMENSFLRSKQLNSRIQQAADRFYSVYRGHNRKIKISNLNVYKTAPANIYPFQLVTQNAGGKYKLYAADEWQLDETGPIEASGYLATDCIEVKLDGTNKLYVDVETINNEIHLPCQNISEDIIVYRIWEQGTTPIQNISYQDSNYQYKQVKLVTTLNELFTTSLAEDEECFCAITMPNYGVRLFSKTQIPLENHYLVKYLTCPDPTVEEKDPASSIKNLNNCKITDNTTFELLRPTQYRLEDLDAIYLYASNNLKMGSVLKSINSLEDVIPEIFPQFQSYKMLVGPVGINFSSSSTMTNDNVILHDVVNTSAGTQQTASSPTLIEYVPNGTVFIYYVPKGQLDIPYTTSGGITTYSQNIIPPSTLQTQINQFIQKAKAYYIPDGTQFYFKYVNEQQADSTIPPAHVKILEGYRIKIYYNKSIDYQVVRNIIESFQYQIGEDFNPYKIISTIVTNDALYGNVRYVEILQNNQPAAVVKVAQDQRWWFKESYSELVEFIQS